MQIELGPFRPRERPFALVPLDELLARMADLQLHLRLARPAGVLTFEEMAEKALLQIDAVVGVEMRPVLDTVHLQPFLARGGAHEPFEIAARMQPLPAPVCGRE